MNQNSDSSVTGSALSNEETETCEKQLDPSSRQHQPTSFISIQEFFDFLSSAFKSNLDIDERGYYRELLTNEFATKLLEISVEKFRKNVDSEGKISSKLYSLERNRGPEARTSFSQEDEQTQGIRSLSIRINRKPDDPSFSFSHLSILEAESILKSKLEEIVDEGILDSMFPFLISKFNSALNLKNIDENQAQESYHKSSKHTNNKNRARKVHNPEAEIEIQVCDEVNNVSKNFKCSQSLLLSKMEYFAEVTEGQRLEDMDISVHCDITIFEWLMKWVHRPTKDRSPTLNVHNITPILISAMFLRMEPLVDECVKFFKENMKEIVETNTSFSCLSDSILEKIADTMSNVELDSLEDPHDKIQSKLFTKFIMSLTKRRIEKEKGHHTTLASLFRCFYCKQILHEDSGLTVPCVPEFLTVDFKGNIQGRHKEDTSWNLNCHIKQLKRELGSWRNVYWRLWGTCHYLECARCRQSYPLTASLCCRYHPHGAHFASKLASSSLLIPVGRFVCCGARTHKFDVLGLPSGCMFRSHLPQETKFSTKLIPVLEKKRGVICICPSESLLIEEKDVYNTFPHNFCWWPISRGNYLDKLYLFNELTGGIDDRDSDLDLEYETGSSMKAVEENDNQSSESEFNDIASIGDGEDSETSCSSKKCYPPPKSQTNTRLWTTQRSIRFNQDNQREREERIIKNIIHKLSRNKNDEFDIFTPKSEYNVFNSPEGGVYALLEEEWKEEIAHMELASATSTTPLKSPKSKLSKYTYF